MLFIFTAVDAHGQGLLYKSIPDCFLKIWRTEGFFGFYKGVTANYMRLAPHGALTLVFWDMLKDLQVGFKAIDNKIWKWKCSYILEFCSRVLVEYLLDVKYLYEREDVY